MVLYPEHDVLGARPAPRRERRRWLPAARSPSCAASTSAGCCVPTGSSSRACSGTPATPSGSPATSPACAVASTYLRDLGVTYLHLMPLLQPRDGDNDGGYAVQDYRTVRADLGDVDDLRALASDLRGQGISLVLDLVLNHVAREHEWARRARAGESRYRDYFHVYPDRVMPDAYERTLPEVFPDFAPGNFTLGRPSSAAGSGRPSTSGSGTSTGPTPTSSSSTPTSCCTSRTSASRCSGSTRSPSRGSGSGPTARTSPRCTPSPRPCAPSPASPARPSPSRPRPSSAPATSCSTSARGDTPAGSATSRTTTASWCRSGRCSRRAAPASPNRRCRALPDDAAERHVDLLRPLPRRHRVGHRRRRRRRRRPRRPRPPPLPLRLVCRRPPRLVGATGSSSSTTRPPATSGSAARRPRSSGSPTRAARRRRRIGSRWRGSSSPMPSSPAGAASRSSGAATSSACRTTRTGRGSPATRTTTAGRTASGSTGTGRRAARRPRARRPGKVFQGLAAPRPRCAPACRSCTHRRRPGWSPRPTTASSPSCARTRAARWSASTT